MGIVKFLLKLFLWFMAFMSVYLIWTNPYVNPYKLYMIFGKKGSGKSTILTKLAMQYLKRGWTVYSTEHIPGVYYITPGCIGIYHLPDVNFVPINLDNYSGLHKFFMRIRLKFFPHRPKVLLLIDEVGMIYDNRNFKNFDARVRDFFKLQRHYYVRCYMFSQTFDVDKKLRDLTDCMYLVKNVGRVFCYGKRIVKKQTINNDASDGSGGKIVEAYEFEPFLLFWLGSRTLTYIPKYAKHFNSFIAPQLPSLSFELVKYEADKLPEVDGGAEGSTEGDNIVNESV